ncbi:AraC family transcriptional regulator [Mediterraneibacter massiliensis]|uniref:AraC family transcriptional regulator n=1 Tax=Mediterraneibacter massiliensis TaxID=1720300 RepID=UPI0024AD75B4|nr:AraC family transcriptional regulator [Mediterraneibacter massiliensis]
MKYIKYREEKKHGTFDFPIEFYHVTASHPRYEMSYHWHIEYEIIRIIKGQLTMTFGDSEFTAGSGDIIFVPSGALHGGIPDHCVYECIVFNLGTLLSSNHAGEKFFKKIENNAIQIYHHITDCDEELHEIIKFLFEAMRGKSDGYELTVIGSLYQFFGYIFSHHLYIPADRVSQKNDRRVEQLKKVLEIIETSYDQCLTLDILAKEAGMNAKYFCRFFHEMTHRTPIDYLNYYRIEQACFKLVTSNDSITEVALSCGFNDISYFIKTFKKYKGITPKKYLSASF